MAGYFNYSKSNNAVWAESQGRYPATKCAKIFGFKSGRAVRDCLRSSEWHHTSKKYNITDFFDFQSEVENACDLTDLSKFHRFLTKNAPARDIIFRQAQKLIRENLEPDKQEIITLRFKAGYFAARKRKIKRG